MSAHTPGPWVTEPIFANKGDEANAHEIILGYEIEGQGHPVMIATVFYDEDRAKPFISKEQATANALLIAAAPELLRALKDMGDWLAYGLGKVDGAEPTAEDMRACERVAAQARAAIERAEGL